MWIKNLRIENFMSIQDSGEQELSPGINIVVGQNNSGKTALLRAISLQRLMNIPHRSSLFKPDHIYNPHSTIDLTFVVSGQEIHNTMLAGGVTRIPVERSWLNPDAEAAANKIFSYEKIEFRMRFANNNWHSTTYPSHQLFPDPRSDQLYLNLEAKPDRNGFKHTVTVGLEDTFGHALGVQLRSKIYYFDAQRLNLGHCPFGQNETLASNAGNLAEAINILQGNRHRFDTLIGHLRRIFPTIKSISVKPYRLAGNHVEILVWNVDPASQRDDLAVSLDDSGTGVGQVIAILYVLLASNANVIIIDEPNSFLHPAASRQLISILRQYPRHQYIISTHSPETLSASNPDRLFVLRFEKEQSNVSVLPRDSVLGVQEALTEVGSRLSDVFGSDAIIWVEGVTEEACFSRILLASGKTIGGRVSIVPLRNTGDLGAKSGDAKAIWDIYSQLSRANALLPPALAFSLDREGRNDQDIADLKKLSNGLIRFLDRRMFENYLIHPQAIAAVLNRLPTFVNQPLKGEDIKRWIDKFGDKKRFFPQRDVLSPGDNGWIREVHGAKLLSDLFADLSSAKEAYHKVAHAKELTEWIINYDIAHFEELYTYLHGLMPEDVGGI